MAVYQLGDPFVEDVVSKNGSVYKRKMALYECECGNLLTGRTDTVPVSCGCVRKVRQSEAAKRRPPNRRTHGMFGTKVYKSWGSMIQRCGNPNNHAYADYGGRGISVCESWKTFENFYADMGDPNGLTIDRIDVNGNYCKENCRWATCNEQMRNTRRSRFLTIDGVTRNLEDWYAQPGAASRTTIKSRLKSGMNPKRAIFGDTDG